MPPDERTGEKPSENFETLFEKALNQDAASEQGLFPTREEENTPALEASQDEPAKKSRKPKPHYHDHRERLRDKFTRRGAEAFDDYELLELILFQALPRIDTKPIAKALLSEFGTLAEVVAAPPEKLTAIKGIGPNAAQHLKILQQVAIRIGKSSVINRPVLSSWNALLDYCRAAMQFEGREQFRVLFLDKKNRLIADEIMGQGTVDRAPVYPREIVRRALVHEATAMILVHNHPSGDPTPSQQDIELTDTIIKTAEAIDVVVHDHLIVGRNDVSSFKMLGLM
ncbi:MAG: DNA repair protein RadC [Pseudomonadota bacterium]